MVTKDNIYSDLAVPPGFFLQDVIDDLEMSKSELADKLGQSEEWVADLLSGKESIAPDIARRLTEITDVPVHIWTGLEERYRITLSRAAKRKTG